MAVGRRLLTVVVQKQTWSRHAPPPTSRRPFPLPSSLYATAPKCAFRETWPRVGPHPQGASHEILHHPMQSRPMTSHLGVVLYELPRGNDKAQCAQAKLLQETCNYIRSLSREVDDLSDRLSALVETMDNNSAEAEIVRSLLRKARIAGRMICEVVGDGSLASTEAEFRRRTLPLVQAATGATVRWRKDARRAHRLASHRGNRMIRPSPSSLDNVPRSNRKERAEIERHHLL
ncbi:hypothetical protein B296_00036314 [Ensete ventricosum]|uniref:BHLH domain-containing protein n=1 Tax=Ensete ventricosum TaxID=4639 RepID=A0A426YFF3_ENSVE|nr:hypothetical protein B296_00036314 [Ensete ventricosum]